MTGGTGRRQDSVPAPAAFVQVGTPTPDQRGTRDGARAAGRSGGLRECVPVKTFEEPWAELAAKAVDRDALSQAVVDEAPCAWRCRGSIRLEGCDRNVPPQARDRIAHRPPVAHGIVDGAPR